MAQTKVKLISDGVIVQGNLHASHGITTAHIGEGSNLYYTDARVGSYLSSNGYATQSTIVAAITDSAPSTLDTLNELAAALGDDVNFSTTVTNSIALKAPIASPTFTGFARAPYVRATSSGDIALGGISGISRIQGNSNQDIRFLNSSDQDLLTLVASHKGANFVGNIATSADKRISVGTWDNSAFTGGNAYGFSITSSTPLLHLTESDQTNKKGYVGLSSGNMYVGGLISNLYLQTGTSGTTALSIDSSQNATFSGSVGIGTTSPSKQLHLKRTSGDVRGIMVETTVATSYAEVQLKAASEFRIGTGGSSTVPNGQFYVYDATAGAHRFDIDASGHVGIGTVSPYDSAWGSNSKQLTISGGTYGVLNLIDAGGPTRFGIGAGDGKLYLAYDDVASAHRIIVSSSGNVGIGETSPATKLDVKGTDNGDTVRISNTGTYGGTIAFTQGSGDTNIGYIGSLRALEGNGSGDNGVGLYSRSRISFYTNSASPDVTISDNGSVGIGTTSPNRKLTVQSGSYSFPSGIDNNSFFTIAQNSWSGMTLLASTTTGSFIDFGDTDAGWRGRILYAHNGDYMYFSTAAAERMRINSSGQVGIGGAPTNQFSIVDGTGANLEMGSNSTSTFIQSYNRTSSAWQDLVFFTFAETMRLTSTGNVGIGTSSPSNKLHVVDGNNYAKLGDLQGNSTMSLRMADNSGFPVEVQAYGTELRFNTATTTGATPSVKMNILSNGRVGIGNTSPNNKLEISDTGTGYGTTYLKISRGADSSAVARVAGIKMGNTASNDGSNWIVQAESSLGYFDNADLKFYHNAAGTSTSKFRIKKNGEFTSMAHEAGSHGFGLNGLQRVCNQGYVAGNATVSVTYDCSSQGSFFIQCVFNHYGFISSYGCSRVAVFANGPNLQTHNINNITSTGGGEWTITRVSNTRFTVAKTAGNYAGGGHWFINITGSGLKYT